MSQFNFYWPHLEVQFLKIVIICRFIYKLKFFYKEKLLKLSSYALDPAYNTVSS